MNERNKMMGAKTGGPQTQTFRFHPQGRVTATIAVDAINYAEAKEKYEKLTGQKPE